MSRPQMTHLSDTHTRILTLVSRLEKETGVVSVSELVDALGLAGASSLMPTLRIMQRNGYIKIVGGGERGKRQSIALAPRGKATLGNWGIPVLGRIPAGLLSEAIPHCEEVVDLGTALPHQPGDFLLTVNGYSMTGDGIFHGDKVLLRPNVKVQNGEIAAVHHGDRFEATLKHVCFDHDGATIILRASNSDYPDVHVRGTDLQIAGVFRGLIRTT